MTLPLEFYYLNYSPSTPIPNGPFVAPQTYYLQGATSPLIVGSGLSIDFATAVISASGGGGGGVTQIIAGTGISISPVGGTGAVTINATGGGSVTWATLADKDGASGPAEIALGTNAGATQGSFAIAIGSESGATGQNLGAVAIGAYAGNASQGQAAVAVGGGAGVTNQGANAVALGQSAGITDQGASALALGDSAGTTSQAACSIVINATGAPLENTVTGTTVIAPVRNAGSSGLPAGFFQVAYNPTTGELVYYS
jgi:hypothetical protein